MSKEHRDNHEPDMRTPAQRAIADRAARTKAPVREMTPEERAADAIVQALLKRAPSRPRDETYRDIDGRKGTSR
jgi:hypothetical protein